MTTFTPKEQAFDTAIRELVQDDQQAALNMLCGHLVGLLSALVELDGGDSNQELTIDGGLTSRSITIHEKKLVLAS
jgi:hypothetical protein